MDSKFDEFLKRNSVGVATGVHPLVHTTKSFNLREIIRSAGLSPEKCKVFNEELLYFFVGRPAYQWQHAGGSPRDWELPTCFVFDEIINLAPKRVLPFDSGAHHAGRYPSYLQNIRREQFECQAIDAPRRIISAFYGSFDRYVSGTAKTCHSVKEEFSLSPLEAEVLAVSTLAEDFGASTVDDRRFSIEVQTNSRVDFVSNKPSAVILPTPYLRDEKVTNALNDWGSEVINYDTYGLSMASYFGQIFLKFTDYCKSKKILL